MTADQEIVHAACLAGWDYLKLEAMKVQVPLGRDHLTAAFIAARERYCARVADGEDPNVVFSAERATLDKEIKPYLATLARIQIANSRSGRRGAGRHRR